MTPTEALELALKEEKKAIELYEKLALEHSAIKDLLLELAAEEYLHKNKLEKKLSDIRRY